MTQNLVQIVELDDPSLSFDLVDLFDLNKVERPAVIEFLEDYETNTTYDGFYPRTQESLSVSSGLVQYVKYEDHNILGPNDGIGIFRLDQNGVRDAVEFEYNDYLTGEFPKYGNYLSLATGTVDGHEVIVEVFSKYGNASDSWATDNRYTHGVSVNVRDAETLQTIHQFSKVDLYKILMNIFTGLGRKQQFRS